MAKGVLYCMTTVVPGLIKIGRTTRENFEGRMRSLEKDGYSNVSGLKRHFAIEVDDAEEKEKLLDNIFNRSCVPNTELFAIDIHLVEQLLSALEGEEIYPKNMTKEEVFEQASEERRVKEDMEKIPEGKYHLCEVKKGFGTIEATMRVEKGQFIIEKGSICAPAKEGWMPEARRIAVIRRNVLQKDVICNSPTTAAWVALGCRNNEWNKWKNEDDEPIDVYRKTTGNR